MDQKSFSGHSYSLYHLIHNYCIFPSISLLSQLWHLLAGGPKLIASFSWQPAMFYLPPTFNKALPFLHFIALYPFSSMPHYPRWNINLIRGVRGFQPWQRPLIQGGLGGGCVRKTSCSSGKWGFLQYEVCMVSWRKGPGRGLHWTLGVDFSKLKWVIFQGK